MTGGVAAWGLCATVMAPVDQVQAFVAHHLALGCARLWLFLDQPDDPAVRAVAGLAEVTVTICDAAYWQTIKGKRPEKHQNRQARNMQAVYAGADLPWIGHIDVDEFLSPRRDIGDVLAEVAQDRPMLRMAPWEALHDAGLPPDIFTARSFRRALKGPENAALRDLAFGPYAPLLREGVLSHSAGKCFFRTGIAGLEPRLHGAFLAGRRLDGGTFAPDVALLHFHAEDRQRWLDRLAYRITRGAYQFNPDLANWLAGADDAALAVFYDRVQSPDHRVRAGLIAAGALISVDLGLRNRVGLQIWPDHKPQGMQT